MLRMKLRQADPEATPLATYTQEERLVNGRATHVLNNVLVSGCDIEGPLDPARLRAAFVALQHRHDALRLTFPGRPGQPLAVVLRPPEEVDFRVLHVEDDPAGAEAAAHRLIADAAEEPFDLARGPLVRLLCIRVSPTRHYTGFVLDHVIADGESCRILTEDLFALYEADGSASDALPELPYGFLDYAYSERCFLRGRDLERLLAYWRRKLDGVGTLPDHLLHDPRSTGTEPARLRVERFTIDRTLYEGIGRSVRSQRATFAAACSAALKITMREWRLRLGLPEERAADVAVTASLANRNHPQLRRAVGYFATPCVLRTDLSGDPSLAEAVRRETTTIFGALGHQALPCALMTKEIDPPRYGIRHTAPLSHGPRYANFDVSQVSTARSMRYGGLTVDAIRIPRNEVPRGGIRLLVRDAGDTALAEVRTDARHHGAPWTRAFLEDYVAVLRSYAEQPDLPLTRAVPRTAPTGA
ncbi:hypothetical protein GCM10018793_23700 [Streptomyces sulfonofaciens]|uniref:Condensation domain-containing protein n=1 Tax=Streptomyces sulfonofaciens TaxID=68272 RepID=A0A919G395_9ACTN|nr:condensation domain-containing protein [Streptomyces sulfonofaciens]GHH76889.1 hypothetical protein GCM10018793_23700 [Streptomyces sulfonofaciens]